VRAGNDGALVWAADSGTCQCALQGHDSGMRWVQLSADGATLVTASADRMIKKWDLGAATCLRTLPGAPLLLLSLSSASWRANRSCMHADQQLLLSMSIAASS
jgi:WD40 repeat protein